jgi:hypothetical protein
MDVVPFVSSDHLTAVAWIAGLEPTRSQEEQQMYFVAGSGGDFSNQLFLHAVPAHPSKSFSEPALVAQVPHSGRVNSIAVSQFRFSSRALAFDGFSDHQEFKSGCSYAIRDRFLQWLCGSF